MAPSPRAAPQPCAGSPSPRWGMLSSAGPSVAWDSHHVGARRGQHVPLPGGFCTGRAWQQGQGLVEKEKPQCLSAMAETGPAWISLWAVPAREPRPCRGGEAPKGWGPLGSPRPSQQHLAFVLRGGMKRFPALGRESSHRPSQLTAPTTMEGGLLFEPPGVPEAPRHKGLPPHSSCQAHGVGQP